MNFMIIFCLLAPIKTLGASENEDNVEIDATVETSGAVIDNSNVIIDETINNEASYNQKQLSPVEKVLEDFEKSILENDQTLNGSQETDGQNDTETAGGTAAVAPHRFQKPRVNCVQLTEQEEETEAQTGGKLVLINGTELQSRMLDETSGNVTNRTTPGICSVILFYGNWCQFSAKAAPSFNAMPRYFPKLNFYAIEVANNLNIFSQFAVVALPSVLVLHNGKPVYGFNSSIHSLETYIQFISNYTGLKPDDQLPVQLLVEDYSGPVPSTVVEKFNYNLLLACLFINLCLLVNLSKSTYVTSLRDTLRNLWREVEIQHEHAD